MTFVPHLLARRQILAGIGASFVLAACAGRIPPAKSALAMTIEAFAAANAFNGVALVAGADAPAYTGTFGFADFEAKRAAQIDDVYGIASISKFLTALSVLRLVDRGALDLDAPVTSWLPAYRAATGKRLTLRLLLSNSSGLPKAFAPAAKLDPSLLTAELSTAEAVRRFASGDLVFTPGTRFDYVLENWIVVYAILEAVTGQAFRDAMRALTLDPLGLAQTGEGDIFAAGLKTAPSYRSVAPLERRPYQRQPFLAASGGYFSDATDLLKLARGALGGPFLSAASRDTLLKVLMPEDEYALGGRVKTLPLDGAPRAIAWETGNTAGYRSVLAHRLDTRQTVVLLNNTSLSQRVLDDFAKAIFAAL